MKRELRKLAKLSFFIGATLSSSSSGEKHQDRKLNTIKHTSRFVGLGRAFPLIGQLRK